MIITLTGPNQFAIAEAERQLIAAFTQKHGTEAIDRADGELLQAQNLPDLLQGATLFAPQRLVILKNIASNKSLQDELLTALGNVDSAITLLISDGAIDKRTKLYKFLKSNSTFKEMPMLAESQLLRWVQKTAQNLGGVINQADARFLVQRTGGDQWTLQHELEKLVLYAPEITQESIEILVDAAGQGSAFDLLDAIFSGNIEAVNTQFAQLKTDEDPYKLFGLLAGQVHTLAVVATAGSRSPDEIAKAAGIHPFVVRKLQATAKKLSLAQVKIMAASVATCDMQLKTTGGDAWPIVRLCAQKIVAATK